MESGEGIESLMREIGLNERSDVESGEGIERSDVHFSLPRLEELWNPVKELKVSSSGTTSCALYQVESGEGIERLADLKPAARTLPDSVESGEGIERSIRPPHANVH